VNSSADERDAELHHALNNLFTRIMGAADLALHEPCAPGVRSELESIVGYVREGAALVEKLKPTPGPP
jgi:hypothetical protein